MIAVILADLRQRYGDKVFLTPEDLEAALGISKGQQANLRSQGRFPIPTRKVGGKVVVTIYDLAKHLAGECENEVKAEIRQAEIEAGKPLPRKEKKARKGLLEKNWWLFRHGKVVSILDECLIRIRIAGEKLPPGSKLFETL